MTEINAPAPQTQAKQWWGLAVLVIPSTLLFMMLTILFLAAPKMAADLGPTSAQLLWILDIYGFVMAGFLVAMGVVGDRVGKRRLMVIGAVVFGLVSIAAAMTTIPELMIAWRAVLGLGGAMMLPSTLGLIFVLFAEPKARGIAIGVWAGGISAGVALGPLLSGLLLEVFGWEATFLVAVPVMALVAIGAPLLLPEHKDETARIDIFSALLLVAALLGIIYGIKRFATQEPVGPTAGLLIAGMLVGLWFVIRQLRSVNPLLDVRLFANRTVSGALTVFPPVGRGPGRCVLVVHPVPATGPGALTDAGRAVDHPSRCGAHRRLHPLPDVRSEIPSRQRHRARSAHAGRRLHTVHPARCWHRSRLRDRELRDHIPGRCTLDGTDD